MSPVLPAAAKALEVLPEDNLCQALIKVIKCYYLAYRFVAYSFDASGNISTPLCAQIKTCAANTPTTT